jgi:SAM-dependent methyltransferase
MKLFIFITLVLILAIYIQRKKKQFCIYRWRKALNVQEHELVFQKLYQHLNGFILSKNARQEHDALDYVYGEIEFLPFLALLSLAPLDEGTVFYDLGSGTGKAVLACAMTYPIYKSVGIEILPALYEASCAQKKQLAKIANYSEHVTKIKFILGDFLEENLDEATFIFINSTALFNPTWEKLCARLEHLPHLKTVITTSKALSSAYFTVVTQTKVQMSWGVVLAYIHARKKV